MKNPFEAILSDAAIDPDVEGPAFKDESVDEDGNRVKKYADQARTIFENPIFEKEHRLHLQYIWHLMDESNFKVCKLAAAMFNEYYKRMKGLADESKEMEERSRPQEKALISDDVLPPGEISEQ